MTAATSAKIAMQIAVTNQKTKSIRSACSLAGRGSQVMKSATAEATAPNTAPSATSWTIDPLRTAPETTRRGGGAGPEANVVSTPLETPATSEVQALRKRVHLLGKHKEASWDLE